MSLTIDLYGLFNMKGNYFVLATLLFVMNSNMIFGQDIKKQQEVGLLFSNLDSFGLTYRIGNDKALWKFNSILFSGGESKSKQDSLTKNNSNNLGINLGVGREWRRVAAENLEFRIGSGISFSHNNSKSVSEASNQTTSTSKSIRKSIGFNLILGVNYIINDRLVLGAEILPGINYSTSTNTNIFESSSGYSEQKFESSGFSYGIGNSFALLSLLYRF